MNCPMSYGPPGYISCSEICGKEGKSHSLPLKLLTGWLQGALENFLSKQYRNEK